ncbi:MAG: hypothetical protein ACPGJS_20155, partial [Flammeovirgaceae bacterium]
MFADIHVHPTMKYLQNGLTDLWEPFGRGFDIKNIINKVIGIPAFSQTDFRTMAEAGVQLVICNLHPAEQKTVFSELFGSDLDRTLEHLAGQTASIPSERIDEEFQAPTYNHFDDLMAEYELLLKCSGNNGVAQFVDIGGKPIKCSYWIVHNFKEVQQIIERNQKNERHHLIAVLIAIEGLHALGRGHVNFPDAQGTPIPNPFNLTDAAFLDRVDFIKGVNGALEFPPFSINLTHVFANSICGHAQGLSIFFQALFDYAEPWGPRFGTQTRENLNIDFTDFGKQVLLRLLGIDEVSKQRRQSQQHAGERILIDIKHMSVRARLSYYDIIDQHNAANPDDIIPIFMSHAAVNGKPRLADELDPTDLQEEYEASEGFNPWSINLYDDELIRIHQTQGIIGLIIDQRILAGGKKLKSLRGRLDDNQVTNFPQHEFFQNSSKKRKWARLLVDQIHHIVSTIAADPTLSEESKLTAWDCIALGTDFDGQIDPIGPYCTSCDFSKLRRVLRS